MFAPVLWQLGRMAMTHDVGNYLEVITSRATKFIQRNKHNCSILTLVTYLVVFANRKLTCRWMSSAPGSIVISNGVFSCQANQLQITNYSNKFSSISPQSPRGPLSCRHLCTLGKCPLAGWSFPFLCGGMWHVGYVTLYWNSGKKPWHDPHTDCDLRTSQERSKSLKPT